MELEETVDGMLSSDYKKRFIAEYQQVKIRWKKLNAMVDKYIYNKLDFEPKSDISLLIRQARIMRDYVHTLEERAEQEGIKLEEE